MQVEPFMPDRPKVRFQTKRNTGVYAARGRLRFPSGTRLLLSVYLAPGEGWGFESVEVCHCLPLQRVREASFENVHYYKQKKKRVIVKAISYGYWNSFLVTWVLLSGTTYWGLIMKSYLINYLDEGRWKHGLINANLLQVNITWGLFWFVGSRVIELCGTWVEIIRSS